MKKLVILVMMLFILTACGLQPGRADFPDKSKENVITAVFIEKVYGETFYWDAYKYRSTGSNASPGYLVTYKKGTATVPISVIIEHVSELQSVKDIHERYNLK